MATGLVSANSKLTYTVRLIDGATSANSAPSGAPVAEPTANQGFLISSLDLGYVAPAEATIWVVATVTASAVGTLGAPQIYVYDNTIADWGPLGTGTAASAGLMNEGVTYDETSADKIVRMEAISLPGHFDGIYVKLGTFTNISAVSVYMKLNRHTVK